MKTLKQWYDSLSEPTQEWVNRNCSTWFDKNQADYYKRPNVEVADEEQLKEYLAEVEKDNYDSKITVEKHLTLLSYLNKTNPKLVSTETLDNIALNLISLHRWAWLYVSDKRKKEAFVRAYQRWSRMDIDNYLYLVEDYDNIKLDFNIVSAPLLTQANQEILGMDVCKVLADSYVNQKDDYRISEMVEYEKRNDLFDDIFFCNKDVSMELKKEILKRIYIHNDQGIVRDFFKRIVAVDHCYLRFLYRIIYEYPALAMKLYNEKKPDITGNEPINEQYRYSKEIRKLLLIAHSCVLKRVSKVKSGAIKEIAPLIKLYGFNWDDIYDAMYPEDGRLN